MNAPTIPYHHFWNPKQQQPQPPKSRLRELQLLALQIGRNDGIPEQQRSMRRSAKR